MFIFIFNPSNSVFILGLLGRTFPLPLNLTLPTKFVSNSYTVAIQWHTKLSKLRSDSISDSLVCYIMFLTYKDYVGVQIRLCHKCS